MTTIGRYRIVDLVGAGGMGVVYRAYDEELRRHAALKFLASTLASDEECRARFKREARIAASLNHPNTCVVYEVGQLDLAVVLPHDDKALEPGTPFIAMEFIEGDTLAARLEHSGPLSGRLAIDIALQLAEGLAEAHSQDVVHRDLKPHNVMITRSGLVKIVDFGLAKAIRTVRGAHSSVSTSEMISADLGEGAVIGTCAYMSPEQAAGKELDARSDVFSFGIMLFQMLTGRLPFEGDTAAETMAKILEADPAPWPHAAASASRVFGDVVARCLRKRPGDRYPDARVLRADLREIELNVLAHPEVVPMGRSAATRARRGIALPIRRSVVLAVALLGTLVVTDPFAPRTEQGQGSHANSSASSSSARVRGDAPPPDPEPKKPPDAKPTPVTPKPPEDPGSPPRPGPAPAPSGVDEPTSSPPANPSRSDVGTLSVTSSPRASVSLDGSLTGVTPLTLEVAAGTHEVTLTGSGDLRWRGRLVVAAGEVTAIDRNLNATGILSVNSEIWVDVSLDGGLVGQTPLHERISAGLHTMRVSREGYVTQEIEIVIEEGKTLSQRVALERKP